MNWSMMTCAPLAKSPNCASHRQSMFGIIERVTVVESEHRRFARAGVVNANARLVRREVLSGHVSARASSRRREYACRWLKVPRRHVLAAEANGNAFEQQRTERERLARNAQS